jgi:hypothetical protein
MKSWLRILLYTWSRNRAHGGCDRWTGDAYSSSAPDPTSPCLPHSLICISLMTCEIDNFSLCMRLFFNWKISTPDESYLWLIFCLYQNMIHIRRNSVQDNTTHFRSIVPLADPPSPSSENFAKLLVDITHFEGGPPSLWKPKIIVETSFENQT